MRTAIIPFEGTNLISVKDERTGEVFVALKPIVEAIGLKWKSQHKKLIRLEQEGITIRRYLVNTSGGKQEMIFIRVEDLPAYLYSINAAKVKEELREKLLKFKRETTKVINDYWNKGAVINARVKPEDLQQVIAAAIEQYEQKRSENLQIELEKIRTQKAALALKLIDKLKDIPDIDSRYIKQVANVSLAIISGDRSNLKKQQVSIEEFLRGKKIYDKNSRISFGRFLAKYYQLATGRKPKKSLSIINGKEVLTNYYTEEDIEIIEEAFKLWIKQKEVRKNDN